MAAKVARALEKVLATEFGTSLLPSLVPSPGIAAAVSARAPALRLLAVGVLERVLNAPTGGVGPAGTAAGLLVGLLADPDAEVGAKAEAALVKAARAGCCLVGSEAAPSPPPAAGLHASLASPDAVVRARGLAVVVALMSSPDPVTASAAKGAGLLAPLAGELGRGPTDPLACAAALAAVSAAAVVEDRGVSPAVRRRACEALLGDLAAPLVALIDAGPSTISAPVWSQALATGAGLCAGVAGATGDDGSPLPSSLSPAVERTLAAILSALDAHLSEASVEDDPGREAGSIEAAGCLGSTAGGAAMLTVRAPSALAGLATRALGARGGAGGRSDRVAALHALAAVAGAERIRRGDASGAVMGGEAERALAGALHAGAADGRPPGTLPGAAFAALVAQPLDDVRVAGLRALLPLVAARGWAAADAAACPDLMARLTAASAWAATGAAEWRHACVVGMEGTARGDHEGLAPNQAAALAGALPALGAAIRAGVHGFSGGAPVGHEVATRAGN